MTWNSETLYQVTSLCFGRRGGRSLGHFFGWGSSLLLGEEGEGPLHVGGGVDADRLALGDAHLDLVAVFEPSELLEALGQLEGRLR